MKDVGGSVVIIQDLSKPMEITKAEESEPKPGLCEKWFGTSFWARNILSQDNVSTYF